ncbi:MAG: hypothetical protein ABI835_13910 [Chloroflexota bacterium]
MSLAEKALLVGLIIGIPVAIYVTRRSLGEEKVYGGALAQVFHYLGALGFCMTLPTVITTMILRGGFGQALPLGIGCVIAAFVALLVFAVIEHPARAKAEPEDDVWTEEKARASGM